MGLFTDVENVTMAVSHMPHDDGIDSAALDCEFVGHLIAIRDLMPIIVFQTAACGKAGCTVEQRRKPPSSSRLSQTNF